MGFRGSGGTNCLRGRFNGGAFAAACDPFGYSATHPSCHAVANNSSIGAYQPAGTASATAFVPSAYNRI